MTTGSRRPPRPGDADRLSRRSLRHSKRGVRAFASKIKEQQMASEASLPRMVARRALVVAIVAAGQWILIWLLPWLLAAMTVAGGILQHTPIVLTISGATFVFAAATTGLLRYDEWRTRRSKENKLICTSISIGLDYIRDQRTGKPTTLSKAQAVINLQNLSVYPISYVVDNITASVWGRVNPKPQYVTKGGVIGPISAGLYRDDIIDMQEAPLKDVLEGVVKFNIRYGESGKERFIITKHVNLFGPLDMSSKSYPTVGASDAPQ
jgi:hypothetical protein